MKPSGEGGGAFYFHLNDGSVCKVVTQAAGRNFLSCCLSVISMWNIHSSYIWFGFPNLSVLPTQADNQAKSFSCIICFNEESSGPVFSLTLEHCFLPVFFCTDSTDQNSQTMPVAYKKMLNLLYCQAHLLCWACTPKKIVKTSVWKASK